MEETVEGATTDVEADDAEMTDDVSTSPVCEFEVDVLSRSIQFLQEVEVPGLTDEEEQGD
ncbi:MAG: hypothetical protein EOP84_05870 [Verrucomicrobiaceae bacterium]|nr:MAG: hypothetical protein EOP84_05870 [Verrucomicrobiaceae bacterium]